VTFVAAAACDVLLTLNPAHADGRATGPA